MGPAFGRRLRSVWRAWEAAWFAIVALVATTAVASAGEPPENAGAEAGAEAAPPVLVYPGFAVGESRRITVERSRQRSRGDGSMPPPEVVTSTATVRVAEETEEAWIITWSLDLPVVEGLVLPEAKQEEIERLARELRLPDLRMELYGDGSLALLNLEEVRAATLRGIDRIVATQLGTMPAEKRERVRAAAAGMYAEPAAAEMLILGQVSPYFAGYGYELTPGESISSPIDMPNALTAPVAGELTVTLRKDTPRAGLVTVREVRTLAPEGSRAMTEAMRERFAALAPKDKPMPGDLAIEMTIETEWVYDAASGWFESVTMMRNVTSVAEGERSAMIEKTVYRVGEVEEEEKEASDEKKGE